MKIQWRDELSVDNGGPIDADHKYLVSLINATLDLDKKPEREKLFIEILERLKIYAKVHFRREESLQKASGYPESENHKKEHVYLERKLDVIINVAKKEMAEKTSSQKSDLIFKQTQKFLNEWLIQHVIGHDLKMREYTSLMSEKAKELKSIEDI